MTTESMKPYPAYKDSGIEWIGEIPEGWKMLALKRIASLKSGESITSGRIDKDGEYPVFGGNGLRGYTTTFTHDGHYVLIGRQGALCGNVNYAQGQFWASEHAVVVSPIGLVETKWLGELLRAMNLNQYSVSAAQPGLSVEMVSNLSIPQPPLQEQSIIAIFLDNQTTKIDTLIENKQKQIELLKEERTAIINQAVTKGLNPDVPMRDSGIEWLGEIPEHWEFVPLKHLLLDGKNGIKIGPFGSSLKSDIITSKGYKVYGQENIINDNFSIGHRFVDENTFDKLNVYEIYENDILITMMGTTGKSKVVPANIKKGIMDSHLIRIRNNNNSNSHFISLLINDSNYIYSQLKKNSKGSIMEGLNSSIVKSLLIACPPLNEQKNILYYIQKQKNKLNCEIQISENQIILLQEYRTALISEAVTGKIDLRNQHEFSTPQ